MFKSNKSVQRLTILHAIITEVKAWEKKLGTDEQTLLAPANEIGNNLGLNWLPYGFYSIHNDLQIKAWSRLKKTNYEQFQEAVIVAETQLSVYRNQGIYQPALPVPVSSN